MLEELRDQVFEANKALQATGIVKYTWSNVSGFDKASGLFVITPSGVHSDEVTPDKLVVCDLKGEVVEGTMRPSTDTKTHAGLYAAWGDKIGGAVHTHSSWAVSWSQSGRDIPCYGTLHADYFYGNIPCTRAETETEVELSYEETAATLMVERLAADGSDPISMSGALVKYVGPYAWGKDAQEAVYRMDMLEEVAKIATLTEMHNQGVQEAPRYLLNYHNYRMHGTKGFYGQQ